MWNTQRRQIEGSKFWVHGTSTKCEVRSSDQPASWLQRKSHFTSILLTLWDEQQKTDAWKAYQLTLTPTYLQTGWLRNSLREGKKLQKTKPSFTAQSILVSPTLITFNKFKHTHSYSRRPLLNQRTSPCVRTHDLQYTINFTLDWKISVQSCMGWSWEEVISSCPTL